MISAVSSTVLINSLPAVTLGSIGAHGNVVIGGSGTVLIGDVFTPAPRAPALPLNRNSVPCSGRFQLIDHERASPSPDAGSGSGRVAAGMRSTPRMPTA